jgi:ADP-dependent phosphofructokinase/glucokinase
VLQALGKLVATGLENARMYEAQRGRVNELSRLVDGMSSPMKACSANAQFVLAADDPVSAARDVALDLEGLASQMAHRVDVALMLSRLDLMVEEEELVTIQRVLDRSLRRVAILQQAQGISIAVHHATEQEVLVAATTLEMLFDTLLFAAIDTAREGDVLTVMHRDRGQKRVIHIDGSEQELASTAAAQVLAGHLGATLVTLEGQTILRLPVPGVSARDLPK